ncbi:histone H1-delta-like [Brachionus plicatilis]|uniref:Histone H1-delta-like n=1 Tax=Brachionus plicatilis TaxID=10195 RepID=A0A3M7QC76_BRAPC|nr:histone H1-delta-like [Brachionus plicatilis]
MSSAQQVVESTKVIKEQKKPQVKKQSTHPKFIEMIQAGLKQLNERTGSSRVALMKYIVATYHLDEKMAKTHLKMALIRGVKDGVLKQVKGSGSNGSFKLVPVTKKTSVKKIVKTETEESSGMKIVKKVIKKAAPSEDKPKKNIKKIVKPKIPKAVIDKPEDKIKAINKNKQAEKKSTRPTKTSEAKKTKSDTTKKIATKLVKADVKKTTKAKKKLN